MVPRHIRNASIATAFLTSGSNDHPNIHPNETKDYNIAVVDELAHQTEGIVIAVMQLPNAHMTFANDPLKRRLDEDSFIAASWSEYIKDPEHSPEWILQLPMAKAGYQTMRATQEFLKQEGIADIEGWIVTGASKRGMTTLDVGAVNCPNCPAKIIALAPIVPVVPDLHDEVHRMWRAYGAFTWAFNDYIEYNMTENFDSEAGMSLWKVFDPLFYFDRLEKYPKYFIVSADDEFMMVDWQELYWDKLRGEKHLLINPNAVHVQLPGIIRSLSNMGTFMRSIAAGHGPEDRPTFTQEYDNKTGRITVRVPEQKRKLKRVAMTSAQTVQNDRRDFRWIVKAKDNKTCEYPYIPLPINIQDALPFSGYSDLGIPFELCLQPIVWLPTQLKEVSVDENGTRTYIANPPSPSIEGRWMAYYINLHFESDNEKPKWSFMENEYHVTSVGWVTPNTLPFEDCFGVSCLPIEV